MATQKILDVSEHNGDIDFKKLKAQGYHIILRIGWFGNEDCAIDKKFTRNLNGCINNKIPFGIYVYSYAKSTMRGVEMANWVHKNIANINVPYGIFIDLEEPGTMQFALQVNNAFYDRMKQLRYSNVGFYTSLHWYKNALMNAKHDRFWLAQWSDNASVKCDIWQYTSDCFIDGKRFDANICYYSPNDITTISKNTTATKELAIDGIWSVKTTSRLQEYFGTVEDGYISNQLITYKAKNPGLSSKSWQWVNRTNSSGSLVIKTLQKNLGVKQDGLFGPITCKALQKKLGTIQDGYISNPSICVKALQKALNKGKL